MFTRKFIMGWAAVICALFFLSVIPGFADDVRTDYDHHVNFERYHTFCWGKVESSDPFYVDRIKQAVASDLQAKGWQLVPSGGDVTVFAKGNVHNQKDMETMYNGFGGGWGMGWGWGGWGWGGPGFATTTTTNQKVGHLVIDMFDTQSKQLLWRGIASGDLSNKESKNTKKLDQDVAKMLDKFPPKTKS